MGESICGDGYLTAVEGCDEGSTQLGCKSDCSDPRYGFVCSGQPSVCVEVCGNGLISDNEQCEDGNTLDWDGCDSSCQLEDGWTHLHT